MLVLPADLTRNEAVACLRMLVQGLRTESSGTILVDAAALHRFDSSALAVLLEFRRQALANGKKLVMRSTPQSLRDLASLYGISDLLPAS